MKRKYTLFISSLIIGMLIGVAIVYLFTNKQDINAGLEGRTIQENQKEFVSVTIEDKDYNNILVGMWHANEDVGDGYNDLFSFSEDGTFVFRYSQYDEEKRVIDLSGNWEIIHANLLALTINEKSIIEGGEFVPNASAAQTGYVLKMVH